MQRSLLSLHSPGIVATFCPNSSRDEGPEPQPSGSDRLSRRRWQVRWTPGCPHCPPPPLRSNSERPAGSSDSSGQERRGISESVRSCPHAAWRAADSFTAFTGHGIKSLLSYQHGSLASCRKGDILAGAGLEPEGQAPCSSAALLRPRCFHRYWEATTFDSLLFFFPLHWPLSSAFHWLTENLCCPGPAVFSESRLAIRAWALGVPIHLGGVHLGDCLVFGAGISVHFFFHDCAHPPSAPHGAFIETRKTDSGLIF